MNPLLEQFLSESREFLQGISEKLLQLEDAPEDAHLMVELFRFVHTLKGNSGLFEFPEMTRVLHAGEDLMDSVRKGHVAYSQDLADMLLDAMDFVGMLCDEIESEGKIDSSRAADSNRLAETLRALIATHRIPGTEEHPEEIAPSASTLLDIYSLPFTDLPEQVCIEAFRRAIDGDLLHWVSFSPVEECFFQGDDPFFIARQTPEVLWGRIVPRESWPKVSELDAYRCVLDFQILTAALRKELDDHFRYVPDQVKIVEVDPWFVVNPQGNPNGGPVYEDFVGDALQYLATNDLASLRQAAETMLQLSNPDLWFASALRWLQLLLDTVPENRAALRSLIESLRTLTTPDKASVRILAAASETTTASPDSSVAQPTAATSAMSEAEITALKSIIEAQRKILQLDDNPAWRAGRLKAVAAVLSNCYKAAGDLAAADEILEALQLSLEAGNSAPLLAWLDAFEGHPAPVAATPVKNENQPSANSTPNAVAPIPVATASNSAAATTDDSPKFGRRAEDAPATAPLVSKSLKVDQVKIDRLMNLIGEMVVSKNALPYLAQRAEVHFGVRELSREIKAQYAVINRIAEEMQDAIMQVRMMPVSFVFQRFPRLVRDISRKLGKEVQLVLEGEDTEADKNIIESLADPLIHIVRNSLDHGLEAPDVRKANGKSASGTLTIRAVQEGDQVVIEIIDDGKGIDPAFIKRKAFEKGVIDAVTLERISDRDAINLIFAAGFSTVEVVSDLSGRGVGMDVVRTAVEQVNGTIQLESEVGKGTCIRISLPLSMAVTKVMIVESDKQIFGVPMDNVVETVRVPCNAIRTIKHAKTTVLRGNIIPLKSLNALLGLAAAPRANADNEMAVLVARVGNDSVGLIVDDFNETVDVIQKPLNGVLAGIHAYSGSALMGNGSVLMVLNVREIL